MVRSAQAGLDMAYQTIGFGGSRSYSRISAGFEHLHKGHLREMKYEPYVFQALEKPANRSGVKLSHSLKHLLNGAFVDAEFQGSPPDRLSSALCERLGNSMSSSGSQKLQSLSC